MKKTEFFAPTTTNLSHLDLRLTLPLEIALLFRLQTMFCRCSLKLEIRLILIRSKTLWT